MERQIKRFEWLRWITAGRKTGPPSVQPARSAGRVGGVFDDELDLPVAAPAVGSEVAGEVQCAAAVLQQRRAERALHAMKILPSPRSPQDTPVSGCTSAC